ncbi:MAG: mononuclear molybdenum enzyme YedY [Chloroflexi bacterium RBG_16_57_11]|nr:MAG: mononuclear molybdenum enzyme YedY [Chloroflexi bacterium RBG_16_57_11]
MVDQSLFKSVPVKSSEITPQHLFRSRRQFLKSMGVLGAGAFLAACSPKIGSQATSSVASKETPMVEPESTMATDELGDPVNSYHEITNYNNYYEFSTDKREVAVLAKDFKSSPWEVEVFGLVNKPQTFGLEDLLKKFTQEERIYRLRCVEAWSMVIPWMGLSLAKLLGEVEPLSSARYVRFETIMDPEQMPGQKQGFYPWPYQEGLTIEEAMHELTILATGLYGELMPPQNGAPVRLVVPWKYGFKSIKSIVKIELVDYQPDTMWSTIAPNEYGFYANVNPAVDHPRWSQASERRIGEAGRRKTLLFNGYAEEVAHLYNDIDLRDFY